MDILKLTKSKTREGILRLFFSDINRKYYLRELERILNIPVGNIRRELLFLEKSGIFSHEKAGNQVYYFLNKDSAIFEELKKIVSKTIGIEGLLRQKLSEIKNIQGAFIFGSFAKNKEDSFSDIDLMIIGKPDESILISKISSIESDLGREINYNIFSIKDIKDGLKKKEVFLEEIMANPKIFIIGNQNDLEKIIGRQ
jgi:predicted nucleotidyltransferase